MKNVKINAGDVAIGSGEHYTGIVHSDEGVSITGKNVTVGDRITADTKGVDIQATGDINVDGITAHENINLTTTGESSKIILNHTHNDGSLHTDSQDNDAVVIDVQGKNGSFQNLTSKMFLPSRLARAATGRSIPTRQMPIRSARTSTVAQMRSGAQRVLRIRQVKTTATSTSSR